MKLPHRVLSTTVHRGHLFPAMWPCDCGDVGCEDFLDSMAAHVLGEQQINASGVWSVSHARGVAVEWLS